MSGGIPDEADEPDDAEHGEVEGQHREPLPRDDRVWIHPSEFARPSQSSGQPTTHRRRARASLVAAGLAAGFVAGAVANPFRDLGEAASPALRTTSDTTPSAPIAGTYISAVDRTSPAVVQVTVSGKAAAIGLGDDLGLEQTNESVGSGMVMHDEGYVITSARLALAGANITVSTSDGFSYTAELIGTDLTTDVAVLRVDEVNLAPPTFSLDTELQLGEGVVAVAAATGGQRRTGWTVGTVQQLGVWLLPSDSEPMVGLAASDIPMAPGMAGALVADIEGDVVGMILPVSSSPFTAGVATYFIPSRTLFDVSSAIISTGVSGKPWLGLIAETTSSGLVVKTVLPDSPAESAGILEGEVLLDFNAIPVTSPLSLATAVQTAEIDSLVRINGVVSGQPVLHLLRLSVPPSTGSVLDDSSTDDDDE